MTDPHQHLADFEQHLQRAQQQVDAIQTAFRDARTTATSPDGAVTVTVASGGRIESLQLSPKADSLGHTALGATIMTTIRKAQVDAARMIEETVRPVLGDGEGMSFLREQVEQGIAAIDPTGIATPPADRERREPPKDDDDYYGGPVLR